MCLKKALFVVMVVTLVSLGGGASANADEKSFTKKEIKQIVHDYIMENPQVILQSVDNYQKKNINEKREEALKRNKSMLFDDKDTPHVGNPNGDVTVVEFLDYNCGYCKRVWPDLDKLLKNDPKVKVIFKEYPILGPSSEKAAKWALAAHKQGKYLEFHRSLFESKGAITDSKLEKIAKKLDLNVARMKQDANSNEVMAIIQKNRALGLDMDITGTPAFVIEDTVIPGAVSYEQLRNVVEEKRNAKKNKN